MSNPYYDHSTFPAPNSAGSSAAMRTELDLIEQGFDKLPTLAGNASKLVAVNATATSLEALTGNVSLPGNLAVTGGLTLGSPLLPASGGTGITSLGTGVATWLGTPSSANLAAAVTDETGSGALVFGTSPTLASPTITGTGTAAFGNLSYTGTLTGGTGVVNLGSGQFYKDASGNVGIGTSSPTSPLAVKTDTDFVVATRTASTGTGARIVGLNAAQNAYKDLVLDGATLKLATGGITQATLDASGNLGIGTSSPSNPLSVTSDTSAQVRIGTVSANIDARITLAASGTGRNVIGGSGVAPLAFMSSATELMRLDTSGNLGLGVTPSAWSGVTALQLASSGAIAGNNQYLDITTNGYYNAGNKYIGTGLAAKYGQAAGAHQWYTAPSGTAGNAISFTTAMTLNAAGNLGLGVTPSAWGLGKAIEFGSAGSAVWSTGATDARLTSNMYFNGTNYIYSSSAAAGFFRLNTGSFQWHTAASGTAGNPISFTQAMTLDASGNLGIGTSSPSGKLVVSNAGANGFEFDPINGIMQTYNRSGSAYTGTKIYGSTFEVRTGASPVSSIFIDASNNVGIGTAAPSYKLDVSVGTNTIAQQWQGASAGAGFTLRLKSGNGATPSVSVYRLYMDYLNGTYTGGYLDFYRGAAGNDGYLVFGTAGSDRMTLDASGNLGLGVTPSAWSGFKAIQVGNGSFGDTVGGSNNALFGSNTYYNGAAFTYINTTTATLYRQLSGQHIFYNAPSGTAGNAITFTQAMTLDASGNLAVQDGKQYFWGSGRTAIQGTSASDTMQFFTSSLERARITSGGDLLVGATATPAINVKGNALQNFANQGRLVVGATISTADLAYFYSSTALAGAITVNGSTCTYTSFSDYRLKEDVAPMTGALDKVTALKPVTYKWKTDGLSGQGFIAHELQAVVPECVTGEKDAVDADGNPAYQGIDTSFLVATLTAAIQEQQALIASLTARVASLENQP